MRGKNPPHARQRVTSPPPLRLRAPHLAQVTEDIRLRVRAIVLALQKCSPKEHSRSQCRLSALRLVPLSPLTTRSARLGLERLDRQFDVSRDGRQKAALVSSDG